MKIEISKFLKNHLVGVFIFGVLTSITASYIFELFPFKPSLNTKVEGYFYIDAFDEYEIKYGLEFKSPPKLQFYETLNNHLYYGGAIKLIEQKNDGFKYKIANGFTSGQQIRWVAIGKEN
ncbi:hypothetical protein [Aeromonas enteropelogenes]|uniref:hypothetical protein n=1 Tax=Aeromonas enteropelogenes TaxID=29489 RepID=UPI003B9F361D